MTVSSRLLARAPRIDFLADGHRPVLDTPQSVRGAIETGMRRHAILLVGIALALVLAALIAAVGPVFTLLAVAVVALVAAVALRPALGAYALIGVTPLVAGIDRGAAIPVLRPNEALLAVVAVALGVRAVVSLKATTWPRVRVSRLDVAILLVAVTSSVLPLAWMALRAHAIEQDDVLYSLMLWKYYAVFLVFRSAVRSVAQARTALWISLTSASIVAVIAVLQSLHLFGVEAFLATYYAPYGNATAVTINRGGSTLGLPIAVADLMIFNLAVAIGLLVRERSRRTLLLGMAYLFIIGIVAAAEFSGVIALVLAVVTIAVLTRRVGYLGLLGAALLVAVAALRPVVERRLQGFESVSGLPPSWEGRLHNLENYFWPQLFSADNWILGVRPAARVATPTMATGYIWIESGYTWLLWAGGIPLLASFFYFLWTAGREGLSAARAHEDAVGAAGVAVVTGLTVVAAMMILDPHLTYRGSADVLFALLGIAAAGRSLQPDGRRAA